ncbi:MAG TPA: efflux RND transporter permease subunit [Arenimonas sp.]|nr:efflux RND transporter permease subunit [Arenimonas sp.]
MSSGKSKSWSLAEFSLRRPVTICMLFVSMLVIGLLAAFRLPLAFFPEIDAPFLFIQLPYPGSTPEEVERTLVRPAEEALATLSGIERMRSFSRADGGGVQIQFGWGRDVEVLASEARERMDAIRDELPSDFQRYQVMKFSTSDMPVLRLRFSSDRDLRNEWDMLDQQIKRRLERIPGVARVDISGATPPEVEIAISTDRLSAQGISLNQLAERLRAANFSLSAGQIDDGQQRLRVQPIGELSDLQAVRDLVISERGTRLSDVADVHLKPSRMDYGRRLEGRPVVGLDVFKERQANLVDVGHAVLEEAYRIRELPEFSDIQFKIIHDQADGVTKSLSELAKAGMLGSLLSVLVLFYFLRHWPSTLMVTLAIPVCFTMTLGAMYFFGVSLNVISMMGLLLAVGMMVDNAVVVTESIYQFREKYPNDPWRCAIEGTRGVQLAISAGTLTSIIVFAPNLFGERNQISLFLGQVAITITVALLASWLIAVSLIPMLSARVRMPEKRTVNNGLVYRMQQRYAALLDWTLRHRGWSLLGILLVVALSFVPMTLTKSDMFPNEARREFEMYFQWKGAYPLEQISSEVKKIEDFLDTNRERYQIDQIYSWYSEQGWGGIRINLREEGDDLRDPAEVIEEIRKELPTLATANIGFGDDDGGGGSQDGLQVSLLGDSSETLRELADELVKQLAQRPELRDVRADLGDETSEVQVSVNRERAALYGFSAQEVASYIGIALRGTPMREFRHGEQEVPMWVRFDNADSQKVEDLSKYNLQRADGSRIPLMAVIDVNVRRGPSQVTRFNRQTSVGIAMSTADGVTAEDARKALTSTLETAAMPPGYRWSFGGGFERNDEAGKRMLFNTALALLLIVIIMAALFESLLYPLAIVSGVLFSILGMYWLFWLTGTTFSIMAFIGILVLMGVVVNNGIVMVEHINNLRREGMHRTEALVAGGRERLRPILMTMGTTVLGMIPLCMGGVQIGGDGPPYYPMARAIVGGLVFSTLVSLVFLPTIYALLDDFSEWSSRILRRARAKAPMAPAAMLE